MNNTTENINTKEVATFMNIYEAADDLRIFQQAISKGALDTEGGRDVAMFALGKIEEMIRQGLSYFEAEEIAV
ncbi:MAG: hypothetical protein WCL27_18955 [Betaproteobacteria bacterium]